MINWTSKLAARSKQKYCQIKIDSKHALGKSITNNRPNAKKFFPNNLTKRSQLRMNSNWFIKTSTKNVICRDQMVKASKGAMNRRTRKLKGKSTVTVTEYVRTFNVGDKVIISPKAKWIGMPHLRYTGKQGVVTEKRGRGYVVEVSDYSKKKAIVTSSIHLKLC